MSFKITKKDSEKNTYTSTCIQYTQEIKDTSAHVLAMTKDMSTWINNLLKGTYVSSSCGSCLGCSFIITESQRLGVCLELKEETDVYQR